MIADEPQQFAEGRYDWRMEVTDRDGPMLFRIDLALLFAESPSTEGVDSDQAGSATALPQFRWRRPPVLGQFEISVGPAWRLRASRYGPAFVTISKMSRHFATS